MIFCRKRGVRFSGLPDYEAHSLSILRYVPPFHKLSLQARHHPKKPRYAAYHPVPDDWEATGYLLLINPFSNYRNRKSAHHLFLISAALPSYPKPSQTTAFPFFSIRPVPLTGCLTVSYHWSCSCFSFHTIEYRKLAGLEIHHTVPFSILQRIVVLSERGNAIISGITLFPSLPYHGVPTGHITICDSFVPQPVPDISPVRSRRSVCRQAL